MGGIPDSGANDREIFCQRSRDRSEDLKAEGCQESTAFLMVGMDEGSSSHTQT